MQTIKMLLPLEALKSQKVISTVLVELLNTGKMPLTLLPIFFKSLQLEGTNLGTCIGGSNAVTVLLSAVSQFKAVLEFCTFRLRA